MRDINPLAVRMPSALKERVEAAASNSRRSLNAELLVRLERSFRPLQAYSTGDLVNELIERSKVSGIDIQISSTDMPPSL